MNNKHFFILRAIKYTDLKSRIGAKSWVSKVKINVSIDTEDKFGRSKILCRWPEGLYIMF